MNKLKEIIPIALSIGHYPVISASKCRRIYLYLLIFVSFPTLLQAQTLPKYQVKHYTVEDGLPHDICYGLIQDSKGTIWTGTDDGLVRFNGDGFDVFNQEHGLTNPYVIDVEEYKDDTLLLGTWGGGFNY